MRSRFLSKPLAALAVAGLLAAPLLAGTAAKTAGRPYLGIGAAVAAEEGAGQTGVTVGAVSPGGPAGKAGLKEGDRIVRAGDKEVKTFQDLTSALAGHKPGDKLALKVLREGKEQAFTVTLGDAPKARAYLGVHAQSLTPALKDHLGLGVDKGALVTQVLPDSPAARAGLEEEDVVTQVGDKAVATPEELRDALQQVGPGKEVELTVARGRESVKLKVSPQEAPAVSALPHGWGFQMPEGMEGFPGRLRPFLPERGDPALQKKVEELEKRLRELEQKIIR
jgi:S1-C subfamily serine protease